MRFASAFSLLAVLAASTGLGAGDPKDKPKSPNQIAHLRLAGDLDESPVAPDPLFGAVGENLKTKLDRIAKAAADPNVAALYIHLDGLSGGWAKVAELRQALAKFRATGKKAYAYLESGDIHDYVVAAECDIVCMPQAGWLMVVGLRSEVTFFKNLLEWLGIKADFLQMGVFKAAAEPFLRDKMSPEAKAQLKKVLDSLFEHTLVASISGSRQRAGRAQMTSAHVTKLIDQGPFTPKRALDLGLVDRLSYASDMENVIRADLKQPALVLTRDYAKEKSEQLDLSNPFNLIKMLSAPKAVEGKKKDRIALIYAVGAINTGKSGKSLLSGGSVGSTTMIEAIRQADADPKVRAIVLRVDSPGGSALASDLIWNELKKCKKPVIASMSDVAASGGYYISMAAKKIYAQPGTITGSIGVVSGKLATKGLYEKVGITSESLSRGENAGILSSGEPWTKSQRQAMETMMEDVYDQFLSKALEGRHAAGKKLTRKELVNLAEGRIWTGQQALENGLIDALGSLDDAIADAKVLGGLTAKTDVDYLILPKGRSFLDGLLEGESGLPISLLDGKQVRELTPHLATVGALWQLRGEPVWALMPVVLRVR